MRPPVLPVGDAAGMRAAAAMLRVDADQILDQARRLSERVQSMDFSAPAADRIRRDTAIRTSDLRAAAERLQDIARILDVGAGGVDAAVHAYGIARRAYAEFQDAERRAAAAR